MKLQGQLKPLFEQNIVLKNSLTDRCIIELPRQVKVVNWNSFDVTSKNKSAIFTHSINFTGPFQRSLYSVDIINTTNLPKFSYVLNNAAKI